MIKSVVVFLLYPGDKVFVAIGLIPSNLGIEFLIKLLFKSLLSSTIVDNPVLFFFFGVKIIQLNLLLLFSAVLF